MSHAANEYVKHLRQAPNGAKITPAEKSVLGQLADDHNQDKGCAWPSVGNLASRACMTERHCRRLLRELESKGVIELNPRLRENGGRSSSEYRFCQIDPPFDIKAASVTAKRMELQRVQHAQRPVQGSLLPPDTDVRGAGTPKSGGDGHREPRGADTVVRGARTPVSAQEPLTEPSTELGRDLPTDPQEPHPTRPAGRVNLDPVDQQRWERFMGVLREDLVSIPANVARAKGFTELRPGQNDFDACFKGWWLEEVKRLPNGILLVTIAWDEAATEEGLQKYQARLARMAKTYFGDGRDRPITFKLLRAPNQSTAQAFALQPPAPVAVASAAIPWNAVKAELRELLTRLPDKRQSAEALKNFDDAIAPTQLVSADMDGAAQVWRISSPNAKKTRAVLAMMRGHVSYAMRAVLGGEAQLIIFGPVNT